MKSAAQSTGQAFKKGWEFTAAKTSQAKQKMNENVDNNPKLKNAKDKTKESLKNAKE